MLIRKPKLLLGLETDLDIKISGSYKDYYTLLNKRLSYLHEILQQFKSKRLAMGLFEHEWLKPAIIRTSHGNVYII